MADKIRLTVKVCRINPVLHFLMPQAVIALGPAVPQIRRHEKVPGPRLRDSFALLRRISYSHQSSSGFGGSLPSFAR